MDTSRLRELYTKAHTITARVVYGDDRFECDVEAKRIHHTPDLHHVHPYTDVIGAYAYASDRENNIIALVYADKKALDAATSSRPDPYKKIRARNHVVELLKEKMKEQGIPR